MGTEREKLIEQLSNLSIHQSMSARDTLGKYASKEQLGDIADFIIEDRKRIVEPLVKHKKLWCGNWKEYTASEAIDKAIANAGLE